jgi:drug/metabolite transporter (DMT)-like permease
MDNPGYRSGVILVVIAGCLWSFMGLAIRGLEEAGTWSVLLWRSLGTIPVLAAFVWWRSGGRLLGPIRAVGLPGIIGALGLVVAFAGAIYAIQTTTIANAVFLFAASPLLSAILGWIVLRESVRPATWVAIAIAAVGMVVMVREGLSAGEALGNAAALVSALGFAVFSVALRFGKAGNMIPAVILGAGFAALTGAGVLLATGQPLLVSPRDLAICLAMGAVILGLGMTLYTLGSKVVPAAEMTLLSMLEVLLAPVWVWLILGETATPATFVGGGIVLAAILLNALTGARRKPALPNMGPARPLPDP